MNSGPRVTHWRRLLDEGIAVIATLNREAALLTDWTLGGGTALMLQIGHRTSYDVDIFFSDPQLFGYIKRAISETIFTLQPTGLLDDGTRFVKVSFGQFGEVDFICSGQMKQNATKLISIDDFVVNVDSCEEIVLKKIFYRGASIQPRDIFDIACVAEFIGGPKLRECIRLIKPSAEKALSSLLRLDQDYYRAVARELDVDERYFGIRDDGYQITKSVLAAV